MSGFFWLIIGIAIGIIIGVNWTANETRALRAWEWLKEKAKTLGIGRNGQ